MKLLSILFVVCFATSASAAFKAAYIDMNKAIQSTKAGKSAKAKLEKEFNKKKEEIKKKEGAIKKEADAFEKKRNVLSEKARTEKQAALQKKMIEFQQELQKSQMNIQQKEREMTKPILEKMAKIIETVAKKKGYNMVFEKAQGVLWAENSIDITDDVVKAFEKAK